MRPGIFAGPSLSVAEGEETCRRNGLEIGFSLLAGRPQTARDIPATEEKTVWEWKNLVRAFGAFAKARI